MPRSHTFKGLQVSPSADYCWPQVFLLTRPEFLYQQASRSVFRLNQNGSQPGGQKQGHVEAELINV